MNEEIKEDTKKEEKEERKKLRLRQLLLIAFALSGMTALIYEVVWIRLLQLIFGSTIYAVSTMLTTFLVGFALGSFIFRNIADRTKNPLLLFTILEFCIGLYALLILYLFRALPSIYISILDMPGFQFFQFFLCFFILIIPATLFGATWPTINKTYVNQSKLGKDVGMLYSLNSLGSFLGPIASGFLLIPLLGITNTAVFAAFLNMLIAFSIFVFARSIK